MDVTGLYSPLALQVIRKHAFESLLPTKLPLTTCPTHLSASLHTVRSVLAFSNSLCIIFFARRLRDVFHVRLSRQFLILTCCQFHIMFWIGRTVPNMLVFGPSKLESPR